jgi:hypothetical protein
MCFLVKRERGAMSLIHYFFPMGLGPVVRIVSPFCWVLPRFFSRRLLFCDVQSRFHVLDPYLYQVTDISSTFPKALATRIFTRYCALPEIDRTREVLGCG